MNCMLYQHCIHLVAAGSSNGWPCDFTEQGSKEERQNIDSSYTSYTDKVNRTNSHYISLEESKQWISWAKNAQIEEMVKYTEGWRTDILIKNPLSHKFAWSQYVKDTWQYNAYNVLSCFQRKPRLGCPAVSQIFIVYVLMWFIFELFPSCSWCYLLNNPNCLLPESYALVLLFFLWCFRQELLYCLTFFALEWGCFQ